MKSAEMIWARRALLAMPFAMATVLTVVISSAHRLQLRSERMAGYGFLFGTPWAWLLDHGWFRNVHSRWFQSFITYAVILWIPALLYSASLWLLLRVLGFRADRVCG